MDSHASETFVSPPRTRRRSSCYSCYPPLSSWNASVGEDDYANALRSFDATNDESLALYIHLPFCSLRCPYCGCHASVTHDPDDIDAYLAGLEREMDLVCALLGSQRPINQLHVGGGTPNYLNESQLARLAKAIESRFHMLGEADTSIECDMRQVSASQLATLRGLGFRRISFGVPALDPRLQQVIGRVQSPEMVRDAYWAARDAGFDCVNVDLIHGLPSQTLENFLSTLDEIVSLGPDRIACLAYSHDPSSRPHQRMLAEHQLPSPQESRRMFDCAVDRLADAGYRWIGFDRFSLPDDELAIAASEMRLRRNFMGFKATAGSQVLAFGISGAGEIGGLLVQNQTNIASWRSSIAEQRLPISRGYRLSQDDARRRDAIVQLICNLEIPASMAEHGLGMAYAQIGRFAEDGLVELLDDRIRVTPLGHHVLRDLCDEFGAASEPVEA